jgi:hypothetical protein
MSHSVLASLARRGAPGAIRLSRLARLFSDGEGQLSVEGRPHEAARRARNALVTEAWSLLRRVLAQRVTRA